MCCTVQHMTTFDNFDLSTGTIDLIYGATCDWVLGSSVPAHFPEPRHGSICTFSVGGIDSAILELWRVNGMP